MLASRFAMALVGVTLTMPTWAATFVVYPFTTENDASPSFVGSGITPTLTLSTLDHFTVTDDGFGTVLQAYPVSGSTSAALALTNNSYFTLALSITPGSFTTLQFNYEVGKGGSSDPRGYFVRSSLDGFTTDILLTNLPNGAQQAPQAESFSVDATGQTAVSFRFYGFSPTTNNSIDFRNLIVSDGVPEPASWTLATAGLLALTFFRKRRAQFCQTNT